MAFWKRTVHMQQAVPSGSIATGPHEGNTDLPRCLYHRYCSSDKHGDRAGKQRGPRRRRPAEQREPGGLMRLQVCVQRSVSTRTSSNV